MITCSEVSRTCGPSTPNSVVFLFRLGKGLLSQDFKFFSGIIYNFGRSVFIFSKSGVKTNGVSPCCFSKFFDVIIINMPFLEANVYSFEKNEILAKFGDNFTTSAHTKSASKC